MNLPQARRRVRAFRFIYTVLTLNFFIPAISYIVAPEMTRETLTQVNTLLGGTAWPVEDTQIWHMLAVGNVMTLAFMCFVLLVDLKRFYPALPSLAFLKGFSALYSLALGFTEGLPAFFAVFLLDGLSTVAMIYFGVRARRALDHLEDDVYGLPLWSALLLLRPARVKARLVALEKVGHVERAPSLYQVSLGCGRMLARVLFRSNTIGTSSAPVRPSLRAKILSWRPARFLPLLAERAIAPFDMSGLASSRERIIRHLLGAHHDGDQLVYDLELLLTEPGSLEELRDRTQAVVDGTDPRATYLKDLCVFEGYHEHMLAIVERALEGDFPRSSDPDITLEAFLGWCGAQEPLATRDAGTLAAAM
jgi:hypothetical protein